MEKLNEALIGSLEAGRNVVIVEDEFVDSSDIANGRELERQYSAIFGRPVRVNVFHRRQLQERMREFRDGFENSLVLVNGCSTSPDCVHCTLDGLGLIRQMAEATHNSEFKLIFNGSGASVNAAKRVLSLMTGNKDLIISKSMDEALKAETLDDLIIGYPNNSRDERFILARRMAEQIGGFKHHIGADRDAKFLGDMSEKIARNGCLQASNEKTLIFFSDRINIENGKFEVRKQDEDLSGIDFSKYYAIFIDNNWQDRDNVNDRNLSSSGTRNKIGNGRKVLEAVTRELKKRNLRIPIIYQTAHVLEDFVSEREEIEKYANTAVVPKGLAPKVSRSKKVALKEIVTSALARLDPNLARYIVETVPVGKNGFVKVGDGFLTFSKAATSSNQESEDDYKSAILEGAGLRDTPENHRMYVLSLFHTRMKDQVSNPDLQLIGANFFDYQRIKEGLACANDPALEARADNLRARYEEIVSRHGSMTASVLMHNDTKWDNWFNGLALGDFGSVCPGTEHRDVARALLQPSYNFKFTLNKENIDAAIEAYVKTRAIVDRNFMRSEEDPEKFRQNVREMIVSESIRLACYKAKNGNAKMADQLIGIAEAYSK